MKLRHVLLAALVAGCATRGPVTPITHDAKRPVTQVNHDAKRPITPELLTELSLLAVGEPADAATVASVKDDAQLARYLDRLVADPRFATDTSSRLLLGQYAMPPNHGVGYVLHRTKDERPRFFLYAPCAPKDTVDVAPWWAPDTKVAVCKDSYEPERTIDKETGMRCGARGMQPPNSTYCGCGESLMWCVRDAAMLEDVRASLLAESRDTISRIVANDLPVDRVFTDNATVRDEKAQFIYDRSRKIAGEIDTLPDPRAWHTSKDATPRIDQSPGENAGILTDPHLLYFFESTRARVRLFAEILWCVNPDSHNVETDAIFAMHRLNLRDGDGWEQLAAAPGCNVCHARMDYARQFFQGWPRAQDGLSFFPSLQVHGTSAMYINGIGDSRGEAPATPQGFVSLALQQKEFGDCMVRDVTEYVFGGDIGRSDDRAVRDVFNKTHSLRAMMREALGRYADKARMPAVLAESSPVPAPSPDGETIAVSAPLRAELDRNCVVCHDEGKLDFTKPALPRALVADMLGQVAFGAMPRGNAAMGAPARRHAVEALIASLWNTPDERAEARRYFDEGLRAQGVFDTRTILHTMRERIGAPPHGDRPLTEEGLRSGVASYAPGFATAQGLAALDACKAAGKASPELLDDCLARAIALDYTLRGEPTLAPAK